MATGKAEVPEGAESSSSWSRKVLVTSCLFAVLEVAVERVLLGSVDLARLGLSSVVLLLLLPANASLVAYCDRKWIKEACNSLWVSLAWLDRSTSGEPQDSASSQTDVKQRRLGRVRRFSESHGWGLIACVDEEGLLYQEHVRFYRGEQEADGVCVNDVVDFSVVDDAQKAGFCCATDIHRISDKQIIERVERMLELSRLSNTVDPICGSTHIPGAPRAGSKDCITSRGSDFLTGKHEQQHPRAQEATGEDLFSMNAAQNLRDLCVTLDQRKSTTAVGIFQGATEIPPATPIASAVPISHADPRRPEQLTSAQVKHRPRTSRSEKAPRSAAASSQDPWISRSAELHNSFPVTGSANPVQVVVRNSFIHAIEVPEDEPPKLKRSASEGNVSSSSSSSKSEKSVYWLPSLSSSSTTASTQSVRSRDWLPSRETQASKGEAVHDVKEDKLAGTTVKEDEVPEQFKLNVAGRLDWQPPGEPQVPAGLGRNAEFDLTEIHDLVAQVHAETGADLEEIKCLHEQGLLQQIPRDGDELTSIGSINHESGTCRACVFWFRMACAKGLSCPYCHVVHDGQKQKRIRPSKSTRLRRRAEAAVPDSADLGLVEQTCQ